MTADEIKTTIINEALRRTYDRTVNPKKDYWDATVEHEYAMTCGCEVRHNGHSIMHHIWERGYVYDIKVNSAKTKVTILVAPLVDESLKDTIKSKVEFYVPSITCDVKVASAPEHDEDTMMRHWRAWKEGVKLDEALSMQGGL
jgi:hypothetical protein